MKIAIVDIGWKKINPMNPLGEALGGSETWLVQISNEFSNQGNFVDVYCNCAFSFEKSETIVYKKLSEFQKTTKKYDFIILNRSFELDGVNLIKYIKTKRLAKHIYIQLHDLSFVYGSTILDPGIDVNQYMLNDDFVTIVTLNEWHRENLYKQYPSLLKNKICIPNGVDLSLLDDSNKIRDNRILWSSCAERGLDILLNEIYPLVKKEIKDFGVDVAGYNDLNLTCEEGSNVRYLGKLSKNELYKEQQKHKIWFYPGTFAETFCITMIENVMNGCQIVSPLTFGMKPTIHYADEIKMTNTFNIFGPENEYKNAVQEAANRIISILKKEYDVPEIYKKIKDKIRKEYNWTNSVNLYINSYNEIMYKKEEKNKSKANKYNKKILVLTMSCNNPYFKSLLAVEKDTWVKPILQKKYENIEWFAYTSCDSKHTEPVIDFDDHIIYVDSGDNMFETYQKTQKAYRMILDAGIEFDYVVRTNTSVFVNIDKLLERLYEIDENDILGGVVGYYHIFKDGDRKFMFNIIPGLFIGMKRDYFNIAMSATRNYDTIPTPDDVMISGVLIEKLGKLNIVSPNENCETVFPRYKAYLPGDEYLLNETNGTFYDDPSIINDSAVVQLRPLYGEIKERSEKGHEFEHFYEIYDALD